MIQYPPKVRKQAAADRKRLIQLKERRRTTLYREPAPERVPAPITLPPVTMSRLSDAEADAAMGLEFDHGGVRQRRAEDFMRAAAATRLREDEVRRQQAQAAVRAVHIEVDDDALELADIDRAIQRELERIAARPQARWMRDESGRLAS